ncbi:DinB family protein [Olivibacter sp. CPCC 100613]|uniref:DinB family protein n=1 Tax=Olivibacter sp. CPCC 100613 TaxID=3079931 RepID=UPI002FFC4519
MESVAEVWMRGPITGVPALLQPVAHALLQVKEELSSLLANFPKAFLWERPANLASVAFHLQHIVGVIDRMFTYAKQQPLSDKQFLYLRNEGTQNDSIDIEILLKQLDNCITTAILELKKIDTATLAEQRSIGRKKIPTTLIGLLFHAAEHAQRHTGQTLVTAKIILDKASNT